MKEIQEGKWISIHDRLPDPKEKVIWLYKEGAMHIATGSPEPDSLYTLVTHWHPLPDLPSESQAQKAQIQVNKDYYVVKKALNALYLEVDSSIADDINKKFDDYHKSLNLLISLI